ncbi:amidohydrolase family protein [Snuella sedimenti]|uniref:Amidohydrolase family protein n=1 Tax=Snuella sedimenti TaxID=2798802 RepID=A0A8J7IYJ1_9FLAO|nr:amidohydrolase family protein [Snuella sedimenti]MBJ6369745.1 amidohydrolase family protein [Snuella sedimenti]
MITDFHTHLAYHKIYPDRFLASLFGMEETDLKKSKHLKLLKLFLRDHSAKKLIKQMDDANIQKAVLLIVDDNNYLGRSEVDIYDKFEIHRMVLEKYQDRFYVFAGYHPLRNDRLELLQKGIEEYGFCGIKLYPPFNFRVNDSIMTECYEYANEKGLTILSHTGFSMKGLKNTYADPKDFLDIVDRYPNVNFVLAHAGYKLSDPIVNKLIRKHNVYADLAGHKTATREELALIFEPSYNPKILFGSDWPINNMMKPLSYLINSLESLYHEKKINNPELLENILYNNASKLLSK